MDDGCCLPLCSCVWWKNSLLPAGEQTEQKRLRSSSPEKQIVVHSLLVLMLHLCQMMKTDQTLVLSHAGNRLKRSTFFFFLENLGFKLSAAATSTFFFFFVPTSLWFWPFVVPPRLIQSLSHRQTLSNMMVMMTWVTPRSALRSLPVNVSVQNVFLQPSFQHFHLSKVTPIILWAISLHL